MFSEHERKYGALLLKSVLRTMVQRGVLASFTFNLVERDGHHWVLLSVTNHGGQTESFENLYEEEGQEGEVLRLLMTFPEKYKLYPPPPDWVPPPAPDLEKMFSMFKEALGASVTAYETKRLKQN